MKQIIFLSDWPKMDRLIQRHIKSQNWYGKGTWSELFKTKKHARHAQHREKIRQHTDWLMGRRFGRVYYQYLQTVNAIVFVEVEGN